MFITTENYLCTSRERMELKLHDLAIHPVADKVVWLAKLLANGPKGF